MHNNAMVNLKYVQLHLKKKEVKLFFLQVSWNLRGSIIGMNLKGNKTYLNGGPVFWMRIFGQQTAQR